MACRATLWLAALSTSLSTACIGVAGRDDEPTGDAAASDAGGAVADGASDDAVIEPDLDTGVDTADPPDTGDTPCIPSQEVCNGLDDDCDQLVDDDDDTLDLATRSTWYTDGDGDGFGDPATAVQACAANGGLADDTDCDDADPAVHPGAADLCDLVDSDCDGRVGDALDPCVESFEGIGDGNLVTPYAFATGATLAQPNPNRLDSYGAIVVECADDGGFFGFSCADGVPDGTAALGNANLGLFYPGLRFTLPDPATDVSVVFASSNGGADVFTLTAWDAGGVQVATTAGAGDAAPWPSNTLHVNGAGIASVVVGGDGAGSVLIDELTWR